MFMLIMICLKQLQAKLGPSGAFDATLILCRGVCCFATLTTFCRRAMTATHVAEPKQYFPSCLWQWKPVTREKVCNFRTGLHHGAVIFTHQPSRTVDLNRDHSSSQISDRLFALRHSLLICIHTIYFYQSPCLLDRSLHTRACITLSILRATSFGFMTAAVIITTRRTAPAQYKKTKHKTPFFEYRWVKS